MRGGGWDASANRVGVRPPPSGALRVLAVGGVVIVAGALALAGCGDDRPGADEREVARLPASPTPALDLLLVIDDSPGLVEAQFALVQALPGVLDALEAETGGALDLHLGVVTTDLGTLDATGAIGATLGQPGNGGCAGSGDDGALQVFGAPITGAFLVDAPADGGRRRNYTGDRATVIQQMVTGAGAGGCGFEQPLAAMRRALVHPANAGFRRPGAHLAVVLLADEDDCSLLDHGLVDAARTELGPLQSFRCTREGVTCDQPLTEAGVKTGCRASETSAFVEGLAGFEDALRAEVADAAELTVIAMIGDPSSVEIELRVPPGGDTPQLALAASCRWTGDNGVVVADPGVRLAGLAGRFGSRGFVESLCGDAPTAITARLAGVLAAPLAGRACLDTAVLHDVAHDAPGVQPRCTVEEGAPGESPVVLPQCPAAGTCYDLIVDAEACPDEGALRLAITRTTPAAAGAVISARCELALE